MKCQFLHHFLDLGVSGRGGFGEEGGKWALTPRAPDYSTACIGYFKNLYSVSSSLVICRLNVDPTELNLTPYDMLR